MNKVLTGDAVEMLKTLPDGCVQCCVTSPPYWGLRDYGVPGQIGLEKTPEEYVGKLVEVFREVRRALRKDGVFFLNLGDSYVGGKGASGQGSGEYQARRVDVSINRPHHQIGGPKQTRALDDMRVLRGSGLKPKDLVGIPWMVAFALRADGWYLRSDIVWSKPNPMPESVTDRPTKAHEYIFLMSKSAKYYYDADAIREPLSEATLRELRDGYNGKAKKDYTRARAQDPSATKTRIIENKRKQYEARQAGGGSNIKGHNGIWNVNGDPILNVGGRNARSVWEITTKPYPGAHFATFPDKIPELCIKAGSRPGHTILDPFGGSGTTGRVAKRLGRRYILIELNPKYSGELIEPSLEAIDPLFANAG